MSIIKLGTELLNRRVQGKCFHGQSEDVIDEHVRLQHVISSMETLISQIPWMEAGRRTMSSWTMCASSIVKINFVTNLKNCATNKFDRSTSHESQDLQWQKTRTPPQALKLIPIVESQSHSKWSGLTFSNKTKVLNTMVPLLLTGNPGKSTSTSTKQLGPFTCPGQSDEQQGEKHQLKWSS